MKIIGITGTIASGKSTLVTMLRRDRFNVFDSDMCASESMQNKTIVEALKKQFKQSNLLTKDGSIDKNILRELVLRNKENLKKLEKITHPYIRKKEHEFVIKCAIQRKKIIFLDIPLLLETKYKRRCDFIINMFVNKNIQKIRVLSRKRMSEREFNFLHDKQKKFNNRINNIHYVNVNSGNGKFFLRKKIIRFIKNIEQLKKKDVWPSTYCKCICEK